MTNFDETPEEDNYSFIDIDPDKLPEEASRQARLFFTWNRRLAEANFDAAEAKANLDLTVSEAKYELECAQAVLDQAVRLDPASFGLQKVVEASVASCILLQPAYKQALRRCNEKKQVALRAYNKALKAAADIEAVVKALAHKKSMIEELVPLELAGFRALRLPGASDEQWRKTTSEVANKKIRETLNKSRKEGGHD